MKSQEQMEKYLKKDKFSLKKKLKCNTNKLNLEILMFRH